MTKSRVRWSLLSFAIGLIVDMFILNLWNDFRMRKFILLLSVLLIVFGLIDTWASGGFTIKDPAEKDDIVATFPYTKGRRIILRSNNPWMFLLGVAVFELGLWLVFR